MISVNIVSGCVSRDTCEKIVQEGEAVVLQYPGFCSCLSMVGEKPDKQITMADMKDDRLSKVPNFFKRGFVLDYNKTFFDYIREKKSDYFIFGISNVRQNMLRKGSHIITREGNLFRMCKDMDNMFDLNTYEPVSPFDFSDDELKTVAEKVSKEIMQLYSPNQIILHKYYCAEDYDNDGALKTFPEIELIKKNNALFEKLNDYFAQNLKGCHVIEFPDNVVSNKKHKNGLHFLHYVDKYYEYCEEALKIIFSKMSVNDEKAALAKNLKVYNEYFNLYHDKLSANQQILQKNGLITAQRNAMVFLRDLGVDYVSARKFKSFIEKLKADNSKVSILKSEDTAGFVLNKSLELNNVEITFKTPKAELTSLTNEEFNNCKKADIIISANVHASASAERDGLKVVMIKDILMGK